jgi:hypothetical protein
LRVVGAVVEHDDAAVREPGGRAVRAAQHRRLRAHLGLERCRRDGRRLHDACERRAAGAGVEQVVRRPSVAIEPAAAADAARRHADVGQPPGVQDAAVERARHLHAPGGAADPEVARAVDREARPAAERLRQDVGEHALREPAGVEPHAGLTANRERAEVDRDDRRTAAGRRAARRGEAERGWKVERRAEVVEVAGALELAEQRRVHEGAAELRRLGDGGGEARHQWGRGHDRARVGVKARQLAVGVEAREPLVPGEQAASRGGDGFARAVAADVDTARGAEAGERVARLGHDCAVVTAEGSESEPDESVVDESVEEPVVDVALAVAVVVASTGSWPVAIWT